jgi:hypothetical protein
MTATATGLRTDLDGASVFALPGKFTELVARAPEGATGFVTEGDDA